MKFTDGFWLLREGVIAHYPAEAYEVVSGAASWTAYAPTRPIKDRLDLATGPVLEIRCATPLPEVISVQITHFSGDVPRRPDFKVEHADEVACAVTVDDEFAQLTSGALSVRLRRAAPWRLDFFGDGRLLTGSGKRAMAAIGADGRHFVREQLDLGVHDHVFGLGERFGPLAKNGQSIDIWNADAGTSTEQSYKNVPFYITDAGYGVFVNHPGRVSFEVAAEAVSRTQFSVEGHSLQYFLIYGPTPKEILRRYAMLTGLPARLPPWSYGLWLSTSFSTSYDEQTVVRFVDGMAERGLSLSVFHFDSFWMKELHWCDFEWNPETFPDPAGMLRRLKARGLRISVWINPYISQLSKLFHEAKSRGFLLKRPGGEVWQWDRWQPGLAVVDFTNPQACEWYAGKLMSLVEMGVDCFKTDFGERIPTDVVYHDGSDPERMHNYYSYLYNKVVFEVLQKARGAGDAVLFARAATAGSQVFPVHWGGDCESTFAAMAQCLRGGLSLGMSGFGYWSHDIGGFAGRPDTAVFKRWIAFGLLSSHSRLHGSRSYRVPWEFDEESVDVLRRFTRVKMQLMPYLSGLGHEAATQGVPMMRPMVLEFPEDPSCAHLDTQYMLGSDILVAPVFSEDGEVRYYVPDGTWTSFLTGETLRGPRWVREHHAFDSLPMLIRPGAVLPVGAIEDSPEYDYADGVTLRLYELPDGFAGTSRIFAADGEERATFQVSRNAQVTRIVPQQASKSWHVLMIGQADAPEVRGADARRVEQGLLLQPDRPESEITVIG